MKFILRWASGGHKEEVSLNSIEDVKALFERVGNELIFDFAPTTEDDPEIMVYDGWIE